VYSYYFLAADAGGLWLAAQEYPYAYFCHGWNSTTPATAGCSCR